MNIVPENIVKIKVGTKQFVIKLIKITAKILQKISNKKVIGLSKIK